MQLVENEITTIVYEKDSGETSARVIIPVAVPHQNIRAIDLSDLTEAERLQMQAMYTEYKAYTKAYINNMLNFENWVDHTRNQEIKPKWRTFKLSGLK